MSRKKLIKSTGIIGLATVLSRIMGFVRDILFAKMFGTKIFAQAFIVAFRLPNMLRDMVGEGAADSAIVPTLTEYHHTRTKEEYWEVAHVILNIMLVALISLSVLGIIFAPILVRAIAPGFAKDPEQFAVTVELTRILFPYILLAGIVAYTKGVLNSLNHFTAPAFSSVVLNGTMILALIVLCPVIGIKGLVLGVLAGGVLEVLMQIPSLKARGFSFGRTFKLAHPAAVKMGKLLVPRAVGTGVYQLSVFVDSVLASFSGIVGAGAVGALYFSYRLIQLPIAVFAISLATAALPKMSKEVALGDTQALKDTVAFSLRAVSAVMIPATVGLVILAEPIVRTLFERGEFTPYSTEITVKALFFYSFGLLAYAGTKILVGVFYSMADTRTPVKTAAFALAVNLALNLALMFPMKVGGLAFATSIASTFNFIALYKALGKKVGDIGTKEILGSVLRVAIASAVMGIVIFFLKNAFLESRGSSSIMVLLRLLAVISAGALAYLAAGYAAGVEEIKKIWALARK